MKRIPQLDGIRGIAIILVMVNHLCWFVMTGWLNTRSGQFFFETCNIGWIGVDVFFVLSGFLITGILLDTSRASNFWSGFYLKRVFRIVPVFVVVCFPIAAVLVLQGGLSVPKALLYLSPFSNWIILIGHPVDYFSHVWSLAIEEQFYLFWPLAVRRASPKNVLKIALGIALVSAVLHGACTLADVSTFRIYFATPTRLFGIAIGSALAAAVRLEGAMAFLRAHAHKISLSGAAIWVAGYVLGGFQFFWLRSSTSIFAIIGTCLVTAMLIFRSFDGSLRRTLHRILAGPVLRWFGARSYAIYLIHVPLKFLLLAWLGRLRAMPLREEVELNLACLLVSVGGSLVLAELSWRFIEAPSLSIGRRLTHRHEVLLER